MNTSEKYNSLLDEAKTMYAMGHDNKYISLQFADKGVDDPTIDKLLLEITNLRKEAKKQSGTRLLIYGGSMIGVAIIFSFISYNSESPIRFVLWGLTISGVLTLIKGLTNLLG